MHSKAKSAASAGEAEDAGGKAGVGAVRGGAGEGHSDSASKTPCGLSPSHFRAASCPEAGVITEFRMGRNQREEN